jgi:hypothetical protein
MLNSASAPKRQKTTGLVNRAVERGTAVEAGAVEAGAVEAGAVEAGAEAGPADQHKKFLIFKCSPEEIRQKSIISFVCARLRRDIKNSRNYRPLPGIDIDALNLDFIIGGSCFLVTARYALDDVLYNKFVDIIAEKLHRGDMMILYRSLGLSHLEITTALQDSNFSMSELHDTTGIDTEDKFIELLQRNHYICSMDDINGTMIFFWDAHNKAHTSMLFQIKQGETHTIFVRDDSLMDTHSLGEYPDIIKMLTYFTTPRISFLLSNVCQEIDLYKEPDPEPEYASGSQPMVTGYARQREHAISMSQIDIPKMVHKMRVNLISQMAMSNPTFDYRTVISEVDKKARKYEQHLLKQQTTAVELLAPLPRRSLTWGGAPIKNKSKKKRKPRRSHKYKKSKNFKKPKKPKKSKKKRLPKRRTTRRT